MHVERRPVVRDPDAETLVSQIRSLRQPALWERGVKGARAYLEERAASGPPGPPVDFVADELLPSGTAVRTYRSGSAAGQAVVVYLHGGGWVVGSVAASDAFCRRLVHAAGCVVVSVDYRLAPEHPFPAAIEDAVAAITWASERADGWGTGAKRLIVLGDSAGGNIATVAVRRIINSGGTTVVRQVLAYPSTSPVRAPAANGYGSEWPLTEADRLWFLDQYVTDEVMRSDPDVSPLLADVSGMPPTTLLLAGCDPMFDEGIAYARNLCAAGISVDLHIYAGQIHGFLTFDPSILPRSAEALGVVASAIRST